ncbi:tetratricopeptide repeat protein [Fusibacter sp. JL298sf-3]
MKYALSDIVIKSPGVQLREKIVAKYGSIEAFADAIDLYASSVRQYLSSKTLGSSTFKIRLMRAFDADFHDLYADEATQIRQWTSQVSWTIDTYVFKGDSQLLEKLKMLTLDYGLMEDYAIVCRCYAHFYHNQGENSWAKAYIDVAVNTMRDRANIDRFGLYLSDQLLFTAEEMPRQAFRKSVDCFEETVVQVVGRVTKCQMYANLGQAYFKLGQFEDSREAFSKALDIADVVDSKCFLYMRLGDVAKATGDQELAFRYYEKAAAHIEKKGDLLYYVYDEFAAYYLSKGLLTEAASAIDRVFDDASWTISASKHRKLETYLKIKLTCGDSEAVVKVVRRLLDEIKEGYIYTLHHLSTLARLIEVLDMPTSCLKRISKDIVRYVRRYAVDDESRRVLKQILGSILIQTT